jgi:hypothetical protein
LPDVLPGPDDTDRVHIDVQYGQRRLGTVTIVTGGHSISRARAADALVTGLGNTLVSLLRDPVRAELRAAFSI